MCLKLSIFTPVFTFATFLGNKVIISQCWLLFTEEHFNPQMFVFSYFLHIYLVKNKYLNSQLLCVESGEKLKLLHVHEGC